MPILISYGFIILLTKVTLGLCSNGLRFQFLVLPKQVPTYVCILHYFTPHQLGRIYLKHKIATHSGFILFGTNIIIISLQIKTYSIIICVIPHS